MLIASGWSWLVLIGGTALLFALALLILGLCRSLATLDATKPESEPWRQVKAAEAERAALGRVCSGAR